jgi:hypothetical protein
MSKSKLGDVLDGAIKLTFCSPENCDIWVPEIDCPAKHGYLCKREILETEIQPSDIVEIDVEKSKIVLCKEWGIEIDELEQEENRYVVDILHILAQADILKFKSK